MWSALAMPLEQMKQAGNLRPVRLRTISQRVPRRDGSSPVVCVNQAVAVAYAGDPGPALTRLVGLRRDSRLSGYQLLAAALAHVYRQLGQLANARAAYVQAIALG